MIYDNDKVNANIGKTFLRALWWGIVVIFCGFQPPCLLRTLVYIYAGVLIAYNVVLFGVWIGRGSLLTRIEKESANRQASKSHSKSTEV